MVRFIAFDSNLLQTFGLSGKHGGNLLQFIPVLYFCNINVDNSEYANDLSKAKKLPKTEKSIMSIFDEPTNRNNLRKSD